MSAADRSLAVLGGTGFFGKSILHAFQRGMLEPWRIGRVVVIARRPAALAAMYPELVGDGVELVALDVASDAALPRTDYVIHAANTTDARAYKADPARERAAIESAARHVAARAGRDCPDARIVYCSSGAVYGQQPDDVAGLVEDAPLADATGLVDYKRDYAEAKRLAEAAMAEIGTRGGRIAVARCFAFVGPYLPRDGHFAIGNFIGDALAGRPVMVRSRHPVIRSYLHADDLVRWLMTIADAAGPECPVFNVGSDEAHEIAEIATFVAHRGGVTVELPADRASDPVDRYIPSLARGQQLLDLPLAYDLHRAIDATFCYLQGHEAAGLGAS